MVLFCHVTTRIAGRENDDLLSEIEGDGTPYVCMLDGDGAVLGRHRGPHSLAAYERLRAAVATLLESRRHADECMRALEVDREGPPEEVQLAEAADEEKLRLALIDADIAACASGAIPFEELEFALEDRGQPSNEQKQRIAGLRADQEIGDLERSFRKTPRGAPSMVLDPLLDRVAQMHAEGRHPGRPDAAATFWTRLAEWAERRARRDVLAECIAGLEALPGDCRPEKELARLRELAGG